MKIKLLIFTLFIAGVFNQAYAANISLGNFTVNGLPTNWIIIDHTEDHVLWHLENNLSQTVFVSLITNNHFAYKSFGYPTMFNPNTLKDTKRNIKSGNYRSETINNMSCIYFKEISDNIGVNDTYKEGYLCQHPNNLDLISFSYTFYKRQSSTEEDEDLFKQALSVLKLLDPKGIN